MKDTDRALLKVLEGVRGPLASIRAAIETLNRYPGMDAAVAAQLHAIIEEQAVVLSRLVEAAEADVTQRTQAHWPLAPVAAEDLARDLAVALGALPLSVDPPESGLVLQADGPTLVAAVQVLAELVENAVRPDHLLARVVRAGRCAALELGWAGPAVRPDRLRRWREHALQAEGAPVPVTLDEVIERHGAELWSGHDEGAGSSTLRLMIPLAE